MEYEEVQADETSEISADSARKLSSKIEGPFFLEDTGLYIDSLNGFPGPYSSFVYKKIGNRGILRLLEGNGRSAKFITVITLSVNGEFQQFTGTLEGTIALEIKGKGGFGFDPIFIPSGMDKTLAEMAIEEKNRISHRSLALGKLIPFLSQFSMDSLRIPSSLGPRCLAIFCRSLRFFTKLCLLELSTREWNFLVS